MTEPEFREWYTGFRRSFPDLPPSDVTMVVEAWWNTVKPYTARMVEKAVVRLVERGSRYKCPRPPDLRAYLVAVVQEAGETVQGLKKDFIQQRIEEYHEFYAGWPGEVCPPDHELREIIVKGLMTPLQQRVGKQIGAMMRSVVRAHREAGTLGVWQGDPR